LTRIPAVSDFPNVADFADGDDQQEYSNQDSHLRADEHSRVVASRLTSNEEDQDEATKCEFSLHKML
jgi:hypothetical protein